jgi:PBP1b-binding outer membrane lipoprotein LpoB
MRQMRYFLASLLLIAVLIGGCSRNEPGPDGATSDATSAPVSSDGLPPTSVPTAGADSTAAPDTGVNEGGEGGGEGVAP